MKIRDIYLQKRPVLSFEVFPPKKERGGGFETLHDTLAQIAELSPDFISVTCGVDGKSKTVDIADFIQKKYNILSLAHLTCIATSQSDIKNMLADMSERDVQNVLALRGDIPPDSRLSASSHYRYAEQLIHDLRTWERSLCIGAACYPEGHIDCDDIDMDITYMKRKQEAGADFFITQLFFENDIFFRFLDRVRKAGVSAPVSAGIMPILSRAQIQRMIFMCGSSLPSRIIKILSKYENSPEDLCKAGIEYTAMQALDLAAQGVDGVHVYTMNRPEIAHACANALNRI